MSKQSLNQRVAGYDRYFLIFDLCAILFAAWLFITLTGIGTDARPLSALAFGLILLGLFSRERRDEFAEHCWRTATSATFLMLVLTPLAWPFFAGVIDGFSQEAARDVANGAATNSSDAAAAARKAKRFTPSFDGLVAILLTTFFATFEWTRFRGGGK